jgi:hypothetical protein
MTGIAAARMSEPGDAVEARPRHLRSPLETEPGVKVGNYTAVG